MVFEEIKIKSKDKKTKEIIDKMLNAFIKNEDIQKIIFEDIVARETKVSLNAISNSDDIFKDKMREDIETFNVKDSIKLLMIRYEELDKRLMKHFVKKMPTKFILMLRTIITDNIEILSKIKNKVDYDFLKILENEIDILDFLIEASEKISYEKFGNDVLNLLTFHTNIQDYAFEKELLSTT